MLIQESKKQPKSNLTLIFIIFTFAFVFLGTYLVIHHYALTESEQKMAIFEKNNREFQAKIKEQTTINAPNKTAQPQGDLQGNSLTQNLGPNSHLSYENQNQLQPKNESQFQPSDPKKFLSFDQLIGFKQEREAVLGFVDYLKNQKNYQGIGDVEPSLGILMHGCPGTGKTTLARALAKETNLPFFEVSSSLFSQTYYGVAPQMVKDLFEAARQEADKKNGAIIFLDECETIFVDLGMLQPGSDIANVVNQFKTEMTSFENNPEKPIFIIGATNHEDQIDEAIKSRFTYNIEVKPGNKAERQQFLELLIKRRKNPYSDEAKQYLLEVMSCFLFLNKFNF